MIADLEVDVHYSSHKIQVCFLVLNTIVCVSDQDINYYFWIVQVSTELNNEY